MAAWGDSLSIGPPIRPLGARIQPRRATDDQIRTEIQKVMTINGWTGGYNKIFVLYTSSGEGSCFLNTNASCAYVQYCAYHGFFASGATPIIYANIPYGGNNACELSGQTSPNGDLAADGASNPASHEITEAATDPLLNAWFDASGNEIGDICNFNFGTNTWPGPSAMGSRCGTAWSSSYSRSTATTRHPVCK